MIWTPRLARLALRIADLPEDEFLRRVKTGPPSSRRLEFRLRFRHDLGLFARYCFPDVAYRPFNAFHREVLNRPKVAHTERTRTARRALAAPRGIAKSTITKIDAAHDIVYGLEAFLVALSATRPDAFSWSRTLRAWFGAEGSPLWELYGPFIVTGAQESFSVQVGAGRPIDVVSRSFGGTVRGLNEGGSRPTRVIVDDGEDRHKVGNPRIRAEWQQTLNEDILKLGSAEGGTIFDWLGTVLHPDAILARILERRGPNKGWTSSKWAALSAWPSSTALWESCREVWADLEAAAQLVAAGEADTPEEAQELRAAAYYTAHRAEMDAGAEVLDPYALPLFRVFLLIWQEGRASVLKELFNEPVDPSSQPFDSRTFKRCTFDGHHIVNANGRRIALSSCRLAVWLDPIPAEKTGSDYAALAVVARDSVGYRYVLSCTLGRISPGAQRGWMWAAFDQYGPRALYGYESNGFQALLDEGFQREVAERRRAGRGANLRPAGAPSTENKIRRVSRLAPDCEHGFVQFAADLPTLVLQQFDSLVGGAHDDGPDAIERADNLLTQVGGITTADHW